MTVQMRIEDVSGNNTSWVCKIYESEELTTVLAEGTGNTSQEATQNALNNYQAQAKE